MIRPGVYPWRVTRTAPAELKLRFRHVNLTGATMAAEVRRNWDYPGDASIALAPASSDTGIRTPVVSTVDGVTVSDVTLFITEAAIGTGVPGPAVGGYEPGRDQNLVWRLWITPSGGTKAVYVEGPFTVGGAAGGSGELFDAVFDVTDQQIVLQMGSGAITEAVLATINATAAAKIGAIETAGAEQVAAVEAQGADVLATLGTYSNLAAAVSDYAVADVSHGVAPTTGTAFAIANELCFSDVVASVTGRLKSFSVWIMSVGDGSLILDVVLPWGGGSAVIGKVSLSGIAATGLHTFVAGVDYADDVYVLEGCQLAAGSATGGCVVATTVVSGTGSSMPSSGAGYVVSRNDTRNYVAKIQFTVSCYEAVSDALAEAVAQAQRSGPDGVVTEYAGYEDIVLSNAASAGTFIFDTTNIGFTSDSLWTGVEYDCATNGDVWWLIFRGGAYVEGTARKATLSAGTRLVWDNPAPCAVRAGDKLVCISLTGTPRQRNLAVGIADAFPPTNAIFSGATFTQSGIQRIASYRAISTRPRRASEQARAATRGRTETLNEAFPGTSLPTGSGAGQWTATGSGSWSCNNGLISPSAPSPSWGNQFLMNNPTYAHYRSHDSLMLMGDASNIGGLVFKTQFNNLADDKMSTFVVIDGPANKGKVYQFNASNNAIYNTGLEVLLPWTVSGTDQVITSIRAARDQMRVDFTKRDTGQTASINWTHSALVNSGGMMRGRVGAVFYTGAGGMKWYRIRSTIQAVKQPGLKIWIGDSTHDLGGLYGFGRSWVKLVEDEYAHGSLLNCSKGSATAATALAQLAQDFTAIVGSGATDGLGVEIFWSVGVNVDNRNGGSDAQRYAAYKADTLAAAAIVTATGAKFTIVTPTPGNPVSTYVNYLVDKLLSGDLGTYEVIDVNSMRSVASPRDYGTWSALTKTMIGAGLANDSLHPDPIAETPLVRDDFLRARPDMRSPLAF